MRSESDSGQAQHDLKASEHKETEQVSKNNKTTAPRIPAWSPTVVLTGRYSG